MDYLKAEELKYAFVRAYRCLEENKEAVNELNVFPVPDGDTGTNMALTLKSAIRQMEQVQGASVYDVAKSISDGALMGARGNSGVILSQVFRGFARGLKGRDKLDPEAFSEALVSASETAYKAVMRPTEGTMLTVIREMSEFAAQSCDQFTNIRDFAKAVLQAGEVSLARTPDQLPVLKEAGVVDAGGKGLLLLLQGALQESASSLPINFGVETEQMDAKVKAQHKVSGHIEFGYCTELLIIGKDIDPEALKLELEPLGDSLLVVGDEERVKVHVHTNNPGKVLEAGVARGALTDIKIDNMRAQYEALSEPQTAVHITEEAQGPPAPYAVIAVTSGDGIENIFRDLGVSEFIAGGQTMNPSTEDILNAVKRAHAETVYILPNNKNIHLASRQAAQMSGSQVVVIPTRTVPEGFTAMLHFDADASAEDNERAMTDALETVTSAEITFAVRDTTLHGKKIVKGNYIGLEGDTIHSTGKNLKDVVTKLLEQTVKEDSMLITILYGLDTTERDANKILQLVRSRYPDLDVELSRGGQPLYFYIFSIE